MAELTRAQHLAPFFCSYTLTQSRRVETGPMDSTSRSQDRLPSHVNGRALPPCLSMLATEGLRVGYAHVRMPTTSALLGFSPPASLPSKMSPVFSLPSVQRKPVARW